MEVKNKRKSDTKDENKCEKCENKLFASLLMHAGRNLWVCGSFEKEIENTYLLVCPNESTSVPREASQNNLAVGGWVGSLGSLFSWTSRYPLSSIHRHNISPFVFRLVFFQNRRHM